MTRRPRVLAYVLLLPFVTVVAASANSVVLTFEGLKEFNRVGNLYLNYGITFSDNARASVSELDGGSGNYVSSPPPGITSLALTDGTAITMNVSGGFQSSLSFDYIAGIPGSLTLYSGLAGTGSVLATIGLPVTPTCSSGPTYCQWLPLNIDFSGTARSAVFGGQHLYLVVDNIKLNTQTVTAVPEPASLFLVGTGIAGLLMRGRKFRYALLTSLLVDRLPMLPSPPFKGTNARCAKLECWNSGIARKNSSSPLTFADT